MRMCSCEKVDLNITPRTVARLVFEAEKENRNGGNSSNGSLLGRAYADKNIPQRKFNLHSDDADCETVRLVSSATRGGWKSTGRRAARNRRTQGGEGAERERTSVKIPQPPVG